MFRASDSEHHTHGHPIAPRFFRPKCSASLGRGQNRSADKKNEIVGLLYGPNGASFQYYIIKVNSFTAFLLLAVFNTFTARKMARTFCLPSTFHRWKKGLSPLLRFVAYQIISALELILILTDWEGKNFLKIINGKIGAMLTHKLLKIKSVNYHLLCLKMSVNLFEFFYKLHLAIGKKLG